MKQKLLSRALLLSIFILFCLGLGFGWHQLHSGFNLHKLYCRLPNHPEWHISYTEEENAHLREIVGQEFHYLGKGRQSFAFISKDKKHVMKFVRFHLVKPKFWTFFLSKEKQKEHLESRRNKLQAWMESYKLAYEKMKEIGALEYVHLVKTDNLQTQVLLVDSLGRSHLVDLDKSGFIVQKRTDLFYDTVERLIEEKDFLGLKKLLVSYLHSLAYPYQQGLKNKDHSWMDNSGNIGLDEVYEIDVGRIGLNRPAQNKEELLEMLTFYTRPIHSYLESRAPTVIFEFDEEIVKCAESFFKNS